MSLRDGLYLVVVIGMAVLTYAMALRCEENRLAMESMTVKLHEVQKLLSDNKASILISQLKKQGVRFPIEVGNENCGSIK